MLTARFPMARGKGEGSISFDSRAKMWVGRIELPPHDFDTAGKPVRRRKVIRRKDKADLIREMKKLHKRLEESGDMPTASQTVESWFSYWLVEVAAKTRRPSTMNSYRSIVNSTIAPQLGKTRLDDLRPNNIRAMIAKLEKNGAKSTTIRNVFSVLSAGLTDPETGNGHARHLGGEIALLPTPSVSNSHGNDVNGRGEPLLPGAVHLLPTPGAYDGERGGSQHPDKRRSGGHSVTLQDVAEHSLLLPTPTASEGAKGGPNQAYGSGGATLSGTVPHITDWGPYDAAIRRWEAVTGRPAPAPVRHDGKGGKARLNPELTEWMMGWPAGWVTDPAIGLSRAEQLKACGNGVVPQQAAAALRELLARPGVPSIREETAA